MDNELATDALRTALGHEFGSLDLLRDALTHRSFANERPNLARTDNERLEFLGDAVLSAVVSSLLCEHFPGAPEGELTRRRADLVCEASLADLARGLSLGSALRLGRGEEKSGGREKPRLLASALEACIGALYLDGGFEVVERFARANFIRRLDSVPPGAHDFKSRLQEYTQAHGLGTPTYEVRHTEGPDHERRFHVAILVAEKEIAAGTGRSKLEAEQRAAESAYAILAE